MTFLRRLTPIILFALIVPISAAQAHNLNVFAMSNGDTIEGYVYFTGGTRAQQAKIELRNTAEKVLFTTTAHDDGSFAFTVSHRGDYTVFTNTGDGHVAIFDLYADEFAEHLPVASPNADIMVENVVTAPDEATADLGTPSIAKTEQPSQSAASGLSGLSHDELSTLINHAVARQIGPLREEVNAYRNDVRMSDILGGIGVIVGIFGVSAWVMARRQLRK